jgi:hypothetical protein
MSHNRIPPNAIPDWFLETVRIMRDADQGLGNIEIEVKNAMEMEDLDPRLRDEMQYVRDAMGAVKISLSVMDMIADDVLREVAVPEQQEERLVRELTCA